MLRVSIRASAGGPLPKRSAGIAPLIASAARGARFRMRCHGKRSRLDGATVDHEGDSKASPEKQPRHAVPVRGSRGGQRRGAGAVVFRLPKRCEHGSRAEGMTEVVAEIELRCRRPEADRFGFAADIPEELKIAVELNTRITNAIGDDAVVKLETAPLTYESGGIDLVAHELDADAAFADSNHPITDDKFTDGELSDDGNAIEWTEIPADGVNLNPETASRKGFNLVIKGLRANASALGDGEDITANVLVDGRAVHSAPLKVADVTTGLQVKADAAELLRCADDATAAIKIQEGFANAIMSAASATDPDDRLVVTFTGIPEGLKVMVPDIYSPTRHR